MGKNTFHSCKMILFVTIIGQCADKRVDKAVFLQSLFICTMVGVVEERGDFLKSKYRQSYYDVII